MRKWLLGAAILLVLSPCLLAQSAQVPPRPLPEPPNVFPAPKVEAPPAQAPAPRAQPPARPPAAPRRTPPRAATPPRPTPLQQCQEENAKLRAENADLRERLGRAEGERDGLRNSLERLGPCVVANTGQSALAGNAGSGLRRALGDWWSWLLALLTFLLGLLLGRLMGTRGQPKKQIKRKHGFEEYTFTLTGTEWDEARKRWVGIYRCSCGAGGIRGEQGIEEHLRDQHGRRGGGPGAV